MVQPNELDVIDDLFINPNDEDIVVNNPKEVLTVYKDYYTQETSEDTATLEVKILETEQRELWLVDLTTSGVKEMRWIKKEIQV